MDKEKILEEVKKLNEKVVKLNDKKERTANDLKSYIESLINLGEITSNMASYYKQEGWPINPETKKEYSQLDICKTTPELQSCYQGINNLKKKYELDNMFFSSKLANKLLKDYLEYLEYCCVTGRYIIPKDPMLAKVKEKLICDSIITPINIASRRKEDENYQYDDGKSWYELDTLNELYKDYSPNEEITCINGQMYKGAQFSYYIDKTINATKEEYIFKVKVLKTK